MKCNSELVRLSTYGAQEARTDSTMHCYLCSLIGKALHLNEHEAAKWLAKDELDSVKWLQADIKVIEDVRCLM